MIIIVILNFIFKSHLWLFFNINIFFSNLLIIILIIIFIIQIIILNLFDPRLSESGCNIRSKSFGPFLNARLKSLRSRHRTPESWAKRGCKTQMTWVCVLATPKQFGSDALPNPKFLQSGRGCQTQVNNNNNNNNWFYPSNQIYFFFDSNNIYFKFNNINEFNNINNIINNI